MTGVTQSTGLRSPAEKPRPEPIGGKTAELLEQRKTKESPRQAEGAGGTEQGSALQEPHHFSRLAAAAGGGTDPQGPLSPRGLRAPDPRDSSPCPRAACPRRPAGPRQHLLAQVDEHPGGAGEPSRAEPGRPSRHRVPLATAGGNGAGSGAAPGRHYRLSPPRSPALRERECSAGSERTAISLIKVTLLLHGERIRIGITETGKVLVVTLEELMRAVQLRVEFE